jgi:transposase
VRSQCMMAAMLAYPKELRARVVGAVEQGELTIAEISNLFGVGPTFIKKMLRLHRAGEDLEPRHGGGPEARLQEKELELLRQEVRKHPDVTLEELQSRLADQRQGTASLSTICRALQYLGLPRKKKPHRQ